MGLLNGALKGIVAKKLIDEARKPQNQARARQLLQQLQSKGKKR